MRCWLLHQRRRWAMWRRRLCMRRGHPMADWSPVVMTSTDSDVMLPEDTVRHLGDGDYNTVAFELVGDAIVSTVWLGHDFWLGPGPPRIFETMVFGGQLEGEQRRYSTQECAVIGHREMVQLVRAAREIP